MVNWMDMQLAHPSSTSGCWAMAPAGLFATLWYNTRDCRVPFAFYQQLVIVGLSRKIFAGELNTNKVLIALRCIVDHICFAYGLIWADYEA